VVELDKGGDLALVLQHDEVELVRRALAAEKAAQLGGRVRGASQVSRQLAVRSRLLDVDLGLGKAGRAEQVRVRFRQPFTVRVSDEEHTVLVAESGRLPHDHRAY